MTLGDLIEKLHSQLTPTETIDDAPVFFISHTHGKPVPLEITGVYYDRDKNTLYLEQ